MTATRRLSEACARLHTGPNGTVWFATECHSQDSLLPPEEFVQKFDFSAVSQVRVVGSAKNARLLVQLQRLRSAQPQSCFKIMFGSPFLLKGANNNLPGSVLSRMADSGGTSMFLGHWFTLTQHSFWSYALLAEVGDSGVVTPTVRQLMTYHPTWPVFSFLHCLDRSRAFHFIAAVIDPRWFAHLERPGRLSRLYSFLGLTMANMQAIWAGTSSGYRGRLAEICVRLWYDNGDNFVSVYFDEEPGPARMLSGTKRLIDLLYYVWRARLSPMHPELRFDPYRFFKDKVCAADFATYLTS